MIFASPSYAWLLFVLPVIALLKIFSDSRSQKAMRAFASSDRLRRQLLGGASPEWSGLHFGLQLLGLGFLIIAMTRPQFGVLEQEVKQSGRNMFIAIDTSKSMLAKDVMPDRITRARLAALDLIERMKGDRVGLIAFAGRAFLQAPLTTDHDAVVESVEALDYTTIPRGGSSLASAIELALETMEKSKIGQSGMIIFSDGQETDNGALEAARKAANKRLMILTVGVGTIEGDVIPDPEPTARNTAGYIQDKEGNIVHSKLESGLLREVAKISGGEYTELSSQAITQTLVTRLLAKLDSHEGSSQQKSRHIERYQWPLFIGLMCLALSLLLRPSSRKRIASPPPLPSEAQAKVHLHATAPSAVTVVLVALLLLLGLSSQQLTAATADDILKNARRNYLEGHYKEARDAYNLLLNNEDNRLPSGELSYGIGAANMKLGDDDRAVKAFSDALQTDDAELQMRSLRALGNVLYNRGLKSLPKEPEQTVRAWQDALSHLGTALQREPDNKETLANYNFVQSQLDRLKQEIEKQKQEQKKKQKEKNKGKGKGEGEEGEDEDGEEPGDGDDGNDGKQRPQENDPNRKPRQTDAMQEGQQNVPQGQISSGDPGKDAKETGKEQDPNQNMPEDEKRNEETGYSPQQAREQLKNYADEQNTFQHLMREEKPYGGNDY